jgi:hypothetical protein
MTSLKSAYLDEERLMRRPSRKLRMRPLLWEGCEPRCLPSTLTVTSVTDGSPGSLRTTISNAAAGDVIRFAPKLSGARLDLNLGELVINKSLTILGSGQTVDADGGSRVIEIDGPHTTVILSRLTITGGLAGLVSAPSPAYAGGGILIDDASLSVRDSVITGDQAVGSPGGMGDAAIAAEGGGLFAFDSQVNLTNTSVIGNRSLGGPDSLTEQAGAGGGGGLFLVESQAEITGGRIQGNLAQGGDAVNPITTFPSSDGGAGDGGAILLLGSNLDLVGVNVSANRAVGGEGLAGALAPPASSQSGPGIGGLAAGGAIFTEGAAQGSTTSTLSISNASLSNNLAQGGPAGMAENAFQPAVPGGMAIGGAIEQQEDTTLVLLRTQLVGNEAEGGLAAPNIVDGGGDTSSGGQAFGGAIDSEYFTRISAAEVSFRGNLAQGEVGGNSAPDSGTEAGVGGPAQGGAWNLRDTGGLVPSPPLPVSLSDTTFANNRALAGPGGTGTEPAGGGGSGGYASGGAMQTNGIFLLTLNGTSWLNNQAIAQQGEFAFGGALGMSFGYKTSQTMITRSLFRGNLARGGDDPQSTSLRASSGGAILNNDPNTTIAGTTFINNTAQAGNATGIGVPGNAEGGAIDTTGPQSSLSLTNDRLIGNQALGGLVVAGPESTDPNSGLASGGALFLDNGELTVSGDQFSGNLAQTQAEGSVHNAAGGALYINADTNAQLARSSFTGNNARALGGNSAFGGALANFSSTFTDDHSSYSGNQALVESAGVAYGGGLYLAGDSNLSQSTITRNAALARGNGQGFGGGIAFADNPTVRLPNVFVRLNHASTDGNDIFGDHQST